MITIKQNDNGYGIEATLKNENGAIDLTGANVLFIFREYEIEVGINDAINGVVLVIFEKRHTSVPGVYKCEFEIAYPDGRIETVPNDDYETLYIISDLGGK